MLKITTSYPTESIALASSLAAPGETMREVLRRAAILGLAQLQRERDAC